MGRGGGKEGRKERESEREIRKACTNSACKKGRVYLNALARKVVFLSHSHKKLHC